MADVARIRENYTQMFGSRINLAQLGGNKRFLDGLISKHVISQEAERLGLGASDEELKERIKKQFTDASGSFVGFERYKEAIISRYGDIEKFENDIRAEIAQEKLRAFVTASINVSDAEIEEEYKRRNSYFDVTYVALAADKLAEKIQPSDDEMRSYYESHKTDYRYLEPQKKVRYLFIDQEKVGSKLQIPDADLKTSLTSSTPEFKQAGVKVQQIVLKVARKDLDAQVEQKAKDFIAKLRGPDGKAKEEAFAEAARGNSEDPATARNNGFLPAPFKKSHPTNHTGFTNELWICSRETFQISRFVMAETGTSCAAVMVFPRLLSRPSRSCWCRCATVVAMAPHFSSRRKRKTRLQETKDPQKVAQELAAEANMNPAEMVRETGFVKPGDDVPDIGSNQQFEQALEPLNNPNDVGEPTGIKGGFAIPMLLEKKEPRIPEFDEVKSKVARCDQTAARQGTTRAESQRSGGVCDQVRMRSKLPERRKVLIRVWKKDSNSVHHSARQASAPLSTI